MCIFASLVLQAGIAVSSLHVAGCKTCEAPVENNGVTSTLRYTEPTAAQKARDARLMGDDTTPEKKSAETARGAARVTGESRSFDTDGLSVFGSSITLTSTVSFDAHIAGSNVPIPLSSVTLTMDLPTASGKQSLGDLHAKVCEAVVVAGDGGSASDQYTHACGDALGTLDFKSNGADAFDADLTLTPSVKTTDAPSIGGTAHLHHEAHEESSPCPDVGGAPSGGLQ